MEMEPISPMAMAGMMGGGFEQLEDPSLNNDMVRTIRNGNVAHHLLPPGFEACPHNHVCPACSSSLIIKHPTHNEQGAIKAKNSHSFSATAAAAAAAALENANSEIQGNLESSLNSAHSANLLLQALSFDAATREDRQCLEPGGHHLATGVSFCPECRVHVVTSAEELERLFDEYENSDNEDGSNMEWLRGSLLVAVDDAEVMALQSCHRGWKAPPTPSSQQQQQQASVSEPTIVSPQQVAQPPTEPRQSLQRPADLGEQNEIRFQSQLLQTNHFGHQERSSRSFQPSQQQQPSHSHQSILGQPSMVISEAISGYNYSNSLLPRHLEKPKPTRPVEFNYEYRHKVATQAMASRIGRGYSLLEEICPDCEMPLMKLHDKKECVVCPKLLKKIAKYHGTGTNERHNNANVVAQGGDQNNLQEAHLPLQRQEEEEEVDPISAIIAQARSEAPHQADKTSNRIISPDIAEAKQYVMQRRVMTTTEPKTRKKKDLGDQKTTANKYPTTTTTHQTGCSNASEAGDSHGTASMTDHSNNSAAGNTAEENNMENEINWEELLINGRSILSKRLNEGWALSSDNCLGVHCKGTPLLQQSDGGFVNLDYCAVCGGSGNGADGAYELELELEAKAAELVRPNWEELAGNGRALLAERLKQGWTMSSENCEGFHCNQMPLTNIEGGPNSCVVCAGSGNGCDGAYENYKPEELVEEERELVSQEISQLLSMGWVLREGLCVRCLMPLVAEAAEAEDDLCILCGCVEGNQNQELEMPAEETNCDAVHEHSIDNDSHVEVEITDEDNAEAEFEASVQVDDEANVGDSYIDDSYIDDSYLNEDTYVNETLIEAVNEPVAIFGDDNTDQAGRKLIAGWTLPNAGLCHHCYGIQMSPPNSEEIGCINRGCPSALAAAYTFLPEPHESTGPLRLIGRGFSNPNEEEEEEQQDAQVVQNEQNVIDENVEEEATGQMLKPQLLTEARHHHYDNECVLEEQCEYDGPPSEIFGRHRGPGNAHHCDEPSVLSDDLSQVRSVASSALGVILVRLDDAKFELEEMIEGGEADPQDCAEKQVEIAMLIEKLANAAMHMKQIEEG